MPHMIEGMIYNLAMVALGVFGLWLYATGHHSEPWVSVAAIIVGATLGFQRMYYWWRLKQFNARGREAMRAFERSQPNAKEGV